MLEKILTALVAGALLALSLSGCAMPGFSLSGTVTLPPTLIGSNTVAAMPTRAMDTYAIEQTPNLPVVTRQYTVIPAPQPAIPMPPAPPAPRLGAELIPPPRGCGTPCP